jgi:outer membrane protein assembly factor BamB
MTTLPRTALIGLAAALSLGAAGTASAATLAALQDGKTIVWIDTDQKKVIGKVGLDGGASLVGFDVRPADGKLYGLTPEGAIVAVDAKTGKWEKKSQLTEKLPEGATFSVDFNPVADRMRVLSSTGTSYRINVDDGKTLVDGSLKYAEADAMKGMQPKVTAAAYSNSFAGTKETALYDIDAAQGTLVKQAPPNDGILNTIGKLGVKVDGPVAFDIWSDGKGANTGWLLAGGALYTVDIATGAAKAFSQVSGLKGRIGDIAIVPGLQVTRAPVMLPARAEKACPRA